MSRPRVYESNRHSAVGRFLDPKTLARISNLEMMARALVEGFISGLHRSPYLGRSLDFAEHRSYNPGDDIRKIDWRVFARTDRYFVKEFEADTNTNCTVILDISRSMDYSRDGISKFDYGRYLAACLAYFSHKQRDRVGLATFADDVVDWVPPSAKHLEIVLQTISKATCRQDGTLFKALERVAGSSRRRSIMVVISDFYEEPEAVVKAVGMLRGKGNDVVAFHLLDPAELELPFDLPAEFEGMESGRRLPVQPALARAEYQRLVQEHIATLRSKLTEVGVDYQFVETSRPLDFALFNYLANRQKASIVR